MLGRTTDDPAATIHRVPITDLSNLEVLVCVFAAFVLALVYWQQWYRLDRAPARPQLFQPLIGGALFVLMLLMAPIGFIGGAQLFGIPLEDAEQLTIEQNVKLILSAYIMQGLVVVIYVRLLLNARSLHHDARPSHGLAGLLAIGALLLIWPMATAVGIVSSMAATWYTGEAIDPIAHSLLAQLAESSLTFWPLALIALVTIGAPILEEVLYRGIVQESLSRMGLSRWGAIVIASVIFAVMHLTMVDAWALVVLFVLSLGFGWAYEKTGRLTTPIVMHMLFNAGNIVLAMSMD